MLLVGQLGFRGAPCLFVLELGDVDIRADQARRPAVFVPLDRAAAGQDPDPAAVNMPLAVLEAELVDLAAVGLPDMLAHAFEIVRMQAGFPKFQGIVEFPFEGKAAHGLPGVGIKQRLVVGVVLPDRVLGGFDGVTEDAFLVGQLLACDRT